MLYDDEEMKKIRAQQFGRRPTTGGTSSILDNVTTSWAPKIYKGYGLDSDEADLNKKWLNAMDEYYKDDPEFQEKVTHLNVDHPERSVGYSDIPGLYSLQREHVIHEEKEKRIARTKTFLQNHRDHPKELGFDTFVNAPIRAERERLLREQEDIHSRSGFLGGIAGSVTGFVGEMGVGVTDPVNLSVMVGGAVLIASTDGLAIPFLAGVARPVATEAVLNGLVAAGDAVVEKQTAKRIGYEDDESIVGAFGSGAVAGALFGAGGHALVGGLKYALRGTSKLAQKIRAGNVDAQGHADLVNEVIDDVAQRGKKAWKEHTGQDYYPSKVEDGAQTMRANALAGFDDIPQGLTPEEHYANLQKTEEALTQGGLPTDLIEPLDFDSNPSYFKLDDNTAFNLSHPDYTHPEFGTVKEAMPHVAQMPQTHEINTPQRLKLRNDIANTLYGTGAKNKNRIAHIILGPPSSGKSTLADPLVAKEGALLIDADEAKKLLPEFKGGIGANAVHEESNIISNKVLDDAINRGDNVVLPIVGKTLKGVIRRVDKLQENGYKVHIHLVEAPLSVTIDRALKRYAKTGRFVPPEYLMTVGNKPRQVFEHLKQTRKDLHGFKEINTGQDVGQLAGLVRSNGRKRQSKLGQILGQESPTGQKPTGQNRPQEISPPTTQEIKQGQAFDDVSMKELKHQIKHMDANIKDRLDKARLDKADYNLDTIIDVEGGDKNTAPDSKTTLKQALNDANNDLSLQQNIKKCGL